MLVQCPECATKYNLDEAKLAPTGSKVRCVRCKNVFTVSRPTPAPSPAPDPTPDLDPNDELDRLFDEAVGHNSAARPAPEDSAKAPVDESMLADLQGAFQQPLIDRSEPLGEPDPAPAQKKKSGKTGLILALLLLVFAAGLAGVYFLQPALLGLKPAQPPTPEGPAPAANQSAAQIVLENVRQYFVPNEKEGQLFIIEGKAVNRFPEARELIRLKASLYDKQGNVVNSQEFMAGNVATLYQLQVSARQDIDLALGSKVGILTNNSNVQPGASVPFMVVFFKAPDTVEEFGLEVLQSAAPKQ